MMTHMKYSERLVRHEAARRMADSRSWHVTGMIASVSATVSRTLFVWLAMLLVAPWSGQIAHGAEPPLTSIISIRALTAEQAAKRLPVLVDATVTFRNSRQSNLIANDGREGIYVAVPEGMGTELKLGSRIRIEGVTQPGGFLPIIECRHITHLGDGTPPPPKRIDAAELFSPSLDCQWVEVAAVMTGVLWHDNSLVITAEISGWTVRLLVPTGEDAVQKASQLMQRPVTIRGVVGSVFNSQRQLAGRHFFVPSFDQIVPSEAPAPEGEPRLSPVNELLRSDSNSSTRVRVRGVVTHTTDDGLYMRGDGGSIFVHTAAKGIVLGTRVEAEGFAAVAPFRPVLRATRVTPLSIAIPPQPQVLNLNDRQLGTQQAELVTVDATVQAQRDGPNHESTLQCRTGDWFFEATLPPRIDPYPRYAPDTRLRLTGICELTTTRPLPFSESVDGFRLHLRGGNDAAIIQHPPWWTLRRTLWALGILGAASLVFLGWAALLRQRVTEQTRIIGTQIERSAVKDERERIARELHDTIEQELAGLSIQLRNARQRIATAPEQASQSLGLAEQMLRHCREEARTSIRDLRSTALELRGLHGALEEMLTPLATEAGAHFSLEVKGEPYHLAGPSEIHLLRIAHEAVANAARHASPRLIQVKLEFTPETISLEVRDDGCGFDTNAPAPRGHFGMLGIRERVNKLQGTIQTHSEPGKGTRIHVVVPSEVAKRSNGSTPHS
jgi:signal transduction histidine kinase